jgi:hypothetical protein
VLLVTRPKHGATFTSAKPGTVKLVLSVLRRHEGPECAATWAQLEAESGVKQRRLRSVAAALDGTHLLLGYVDPGDVGEHEPRGIFVCRSAEESAGLTAHLRAKAIDEFVRARRRRAFARRMALPEPVAQLALGLAS